MLKSGTLKPTTSQKPVTTNAVKPLQPIKQPAGNEQERHKKPKSDDYDNDLKYRRTEKTSTEGEHLLFNFHSLFYNYVANLRIDLVTNL